MKNKTEKVNEKQRNREEEKKKVVVVPGSRDGRACHCGDDNCSCNEADTVEWTEKVAAAGWNAHTVG